MSRVWIEELGLSKLNGILHGVREHINKNKCHCIERSPGMIGLKLDLWIQINAVRFLCMLQYLTTSFSSLFSPFLTRNFTHYIGLFLSYELYICRSSRLPLEHLSHQILLSVLCEFRWSR